MNVQEFIRHALDGNAVLFTGAGFSWGAKNRLNNSIPSGDGLAGTLLNAIGYAGKKLSLDKASAAYLRRKSRTELVSLLVDEFTPKTISSDHQSIAAIPWRRVYTTNYDTVYEKGRRGAGLKVTSLDAVDEPREHLHKGNVVVHINGSIERVSPERLDGSFKLTTTSYSTDAFMNSPWAFHFRADLRSAKAVIFIGYSMYDLDVRRVLYEEDMSDRCLFITAPINADNELDAEDLSDLGLLAPVGVTEFARLIEEERKIYTPREEDLLLEVWSEIEGLQASPERPTDHDIQNFLILGQQTEAIMSEAGGADAAHYCIPRLQAERAASELRGKPSIVFLAGGLGTGKTFISDLAARLVARAGVRVFRLDRASSKAIPEAESILKIPGEKVFIIDGYARQLELLRRLGELDRDRLHLLLIERQSSHELLRDDVEGILKLPVSEVGIDTLGKVEIEDASKLLDRYGLWGERQAWPTGRKISFIAVDCESRLPDLLVSVLDATHIADRFLDVLAKNPNASELSKILICVSALTVLSQRALSSTVQELLAPNVILSRYRKYSELRDIVDFRPNEVMVRSPVLAQHILHRMFSAADVVDVLIKMMRKASELRRDSEYRDIHGDLMRYSSLSLMLPEKQRLAATIKYYENIKDLPGSSRNPQFWLQYAIGCLANRQLERAERYFDDAYSFARKDPTYDTFQIDNHYARFLLEKALRDQPVSDALQQTMQAKDIVLRQIRTEVRHYPFRVALRLFDVYEALLPKLSSDSKKQFKGVLAEVAGYASRVKGHLSTNRYVVDCIRRWSAVEPT